MSVATAHPAPALTALAKRYTGEDRRADLRARAAALAPDAIAAARSEQERDLIERIFARIPHVLDLSSDHARREAARRPSRRAEERWQRELSAIEALAKQLIELPHEDAGTAARRFRLHRIALELSDHFPATDGLLDIFHEDAALIGDAALATIYSLAEPQPAILWDRAVANLDKARAAYEAVDENDTEAYDRADHEYCAAEEALHQIPAPHLGAVSEKMRLSLRTTVEQYIGDDVDDPRTIAAALASDDCRDREQVLIYQDVLRLAGLRPEIASVTAFDPQPFIDAALAHDMSLGVFEDSEGKLMVVPFIVGNGIQQFDKSVPAELQQAWDGLTQGELRVLQSTLKRRRGMN